MLTIQCEYPIRDTKTSRFSQFSWSVSSLEFQREIKLLTEAALANSREMRSDKHVGTHDTRKTLVDPVNHAKYFATNRNEILDFLIGRKINYRRAENIFNFIKKISRISKYLET